MAKKAKVFDLDKTVMKLLEEYGTDIGKDVARAIEDVVPQVVTKIQTASPKRTGEYARGWTATITHSDSGRTSAVISQENKPYLTHILENGHANRGGGRTKAKKHIKPTQKWAEDALYEEVVKNIND